MFNFDTQVGPNASSSVLESDGVTYTVNFHPSAHLADVTIIAQVFVDGEPKLVNDPWSPVRSSGAQYHRGCTPVSWDDSWG